MQINEKTISSLLATASQTERLRANLDLRTSPADTSQRMLNALQPGTQVAIHRHPLSTETVFLLKGRMDEVFYDEQGKETERYHLCPDEGAYGCVVPQGVWHTVEVFEPSVIFEAKDRKYGEDKSEQFIVK
ncbi:MAG: WbuC family cupin fold metalloprotein [Paludibacteraceae bacterium]|nr:WbuC family cupin fold metalloprotein [Paludibacteraceae bacterium]